MFCGIELTKPAAQVDFEQAQAGTELLAASHDVSLPARIAARSTGGIRSDSTLRESYGASNIGAGFLYNLIGSREVAMAGPPDVASAKVSRSGAIWVAAITAIGGFATAIGTGAIGLIGKSKPHPVVQHWLRIEAVELRHDAALPSIDRVRLVAQVNGVSYGYPTSVSSVWAPVGPGMTTERYPLPMGAETYRVRFFGFGLTADGKVPRYEYRGVAEYAARRVPVAGATQALQYTTSEPSGLSIGMIVHYSVE